MPLVEAKCTNCGANLEVENTKDAAICPYCGTPYVVEKAIKNFNVTNNISADVVNIFGGNSADFMIRAGTLEKYTGAATDVVIPNSVTIIGAQAFAECRGLTSVAIPDSVKIIGNKAFFECRCLTNVSIPNSVTNIGEMAFSECHSLKSLTIPSSLTKIEDSMLSGCSNLTGVIIPNSVITIGQYAFSGCSNLTSVKIPNSVTEIGVCAFRGCKALTEVDIEGNPTLKVESDDYDTYYVFDDCDRLTTISASEQWKKANWSCARCLYKFEPEMRSKSKSSGCYIATAVYGSYDCPQVWTLRRWRDHVLSKSWYGRIFIICYYAISPHLVRLFGKANWFHSFWKRRLDEMVHRLNSNGLEDTPYQDVQWR